VGTSSLPEPVVIVTTCYQPKPIGAPQPPDDDEAPLCFSKTCGFTHMYADRMAGSKKKRRRTFIDYCASARSPRHPKS